MDRHVNTYAWRVGQKRDEEKEKGRKQFSNTVLESYLKVFDQLASCRLGCRHSALTVLEEIVQMLILMTEEKINPI